MTIYIRGINNNTGYGSYTIELMDAIRALGHDVRFVNFVDKKIPDVSNLFSVLPGEHIVNVKTPNTYRICQSMIESDGLHPDWVNKYNLINSVCVISQYMKDVYINSGVKTEIKIVPLGIETKLFKKKKL